MKKFISLIIVVALALTTIALPEAAFAGEAAQNENLVVNGKACVSDSNAAATIDYILAKYPIDTVYKGTSSCWEYAEAASNLLTGKSETKYYSNLKFNQANLRSKCLNAKAGTHLRLSKKPKFDGGYGHSVVLFKVTEDLMIWGDCNRIGDNVIAYYYGSMDDFVRLYDHYSYINMVKKTTKYKSYAASKVLTKRDAKSGNVKLTWLKTTNTKRYEVYRSYSQTGEFKRIYSGSGKTFIDKTSKVGKKVYYRVKSVKSGGSKYSETVNNMRKLAAPRLTAGNKGADILLEWTEVPGADRYYVYKFLWEKGKFVKVKSTTSCRFVDKDDYYMGFEYKIKAVCDSNSDANSAYSNVDCGVHIFPKPDAPVASGKVLPDGSAEITWNAVPGATSYTVYYFDEYAEGEDDEIYVTNTKKLSAVHQEHYDDEFFYYVVVAESEYNRSDFSNVVKL